MTFKFKMVNFSKESSKKIPLLYWKGVFSLVQLDYTLWYRGYLTDRDEHKIINNCLIYLRKLIII